MSTQQQTRSGDGGGRSKGKKSSGGAGDSNSSKKSEIKTEKEKNHPKPTAEQIRIAQIVEIKNDVSDDPKIREKVANLMEIAQRSEEEVCCALNECDNDLERAAIFLLETLPVGAFETSSKKKKNRLTSVSNDVSGGDGDWNEGSNSGQNGPNNDGKERSRSRGGIRGGRGGTDSRGWRGRENRENDRNNVSSENKDNNWRGGGGGRGGRGGRGGSYGGRGGRGGRMGPRGTGPREYNRDRNTARPHDNNQPEVDTWDTNQVQPEINTWGDWDNEEYTGSLADSKVFTPSVSQSNATELSAPPGLEQQVLNPPSHPDDLVQQYSTTVVSSTTTAAAVANNAAQFPEIQSAAHLRQSLELQQINSTSASLSVEQSQYFNSLTSQNTGQPVVVNVNSFQPASVQYSSPYGSTNSYSEQVGSTQPQTRKPPRARVPPPSKIPSTAVEMPGDTLNNIQYLDVQFGGLDFGTEESFDSLSEKFNQANLVDPSLNVSQTVDVVGPVDYQTKQSVVQQQSLVGSGGGGGGGGGGVNSGGGVVLQSPQITDNLVSYNQRSNQQQVANNSSVVGNSMNSTGGGGLDQLSKNDHYNQSNQTGGSGYQTVSSYQNNNSASVNKTSSYQPNQPPQGYTNSNYSNTQVSSNSNYPQSSTYSTYNPTSVNSYQQQSNNTNNSISVNSAVVNSVGNSGSGVSSNNSNSSQNIPVNNSNANSNSNAGYLSSQYPSVSQTGSGFPSQQSGYQNNQSVYGGAGLSNNTGYSTNSSATQYSNFNSTKLKDTTTPVSTPFESVSSQVSSSAPSSVSNSAVTTSSMSSPSLGLTNTKVTNSTAKGTGGVVQNIPMVSQYIQAGMPFYQQPVYSFEEIQMMQQRMPHVPGYYDLNYQTPTSLGAGGVRDGNMASVAYSTMSDARFTRTDNNSSPVSNVPSTMSQQTGSGGPVLNVPYAYAFYSGMPGGFQYGTPAIYPQQMATASATSGGQFAKPSYNSYGSSGYDAIGQTAQDYSKGGYPGTGIGQQSKGQTVSNPQSAGTGSDISSSMYGKSHVALNKVNSYDNKSFHSGTPPPFNLAGTQTAGATSAQFGAQHLYIPTMPAPHHSMNMHQQMHQMDGRIHNNNTSNPNRRDSSSTGQRQPSSSQGKTGTKQGYSPSYWTAQN